MRDVLDQLKFIQSGKRGGVLFENMLTEAPNYGDMFNSVLAYVREYSRSPETDLEKTGEAIKKEIKWAKQTLRKNDRIVWYLRYAKMAMVNRIFSPEHDVLTKERQKFDAALDSGGVSVGPEKIDASVMKWIREQLSHYMGVAVNAPSIANYVFPKKTLGEVIGELKGLEDDWIEAQAEKERGLEIEAGDEIFMEFEHGHKAWWLLDRNYCDAEGKAMGHCGNNQGRSGYDEKVLSFRVKANPEMSDEESPWIPHLTFILDGNGMLGEMKGRANAKPVERYHRYIVPLLKDQRITGIKGGGYDASNNFALSDLDHDTQQELKKMKPALRDLREIRRSGDEELFKEQLDIRSSNSDLPEPYDVDMEKDEVILAAWANINQLSQEWEDMYKALQFWDDFETRYDPSEITNDDIFYALEEMNDDILLKLMEELGVKQEIHSDRLIELSDKIHRHPRYFSLFTDALQTVADKSMGSNGTFKKDFTSYIKFLLDYMPFRVHDAGLRYNEDDIFNTEFEFYVDFNNYVNYIDVASSGDDDDYDDMYFIMDVKYAREWQVLDEYPELQHYMQDQGKEEGVQLDLIHKMIHEKTGSIHYLEPSDIGKEFTELLTHGGRPSKDEMGDLFNSLRRNAGLI